MRRMDAARRRGLTLLVAGALLAAAGTALFVVVSGLGADESASRLEQGGGALVAVECDGWTNTNASLGVFVEGAAADGGRRSEHLLFEGSGSRAVDFSNGECTAVPQLPQIMLQDGRVMGVVSPARAWCTGEGEVCLKVAYEVVDLCAVTDDELAGIAAASFSSEGAAANALEAAKVLRDQAKDKEGSDE